MWGEIGINKDINIVDQALIGDACAARVLEDYAPKDLPEELHGRIPAIVYCDGNCLPRSGSVLAFGNENHFNEIRCRIALELVRNKKNIWTYPT